MSCRPRNLHILAMLPHHTHTHKCICTLPLPAAEHPLPYHECHRNGERKRVYDSPAPEHHFHLQYQLLPAPAGSERDGADEEGSGRVSRSDVVTFGVVSKVYTEQDSRVVRCWEEEEEVAENAENKTLNKRTHFGWRHKLVT